MESQKAGAGVPGGGDAASLVGDEGVEAAMLVRGEYKRAELAGARNRGRALAWGEGAEEVHVSRQRSSPPHRRRARGDPRAVALESGDMAASSALSCRFGRRSAM